MKCSIPKMNFKAWQAKLPLFFRIRGSVVFVVWPQVLFGILYSVSIVSFHKYSGYPLPDFPTAFIPVLGLVIGLLLVFRTSTGYDRYYEGRKLWSNMMFRIRTLARCTWLGVKDDGKPENLIEKRTAINLLVAFAYATKNYLREEYSYDEDPEISSLTNHLPRIQEEKKNNTKSPSSHSTSNGDNVRLARLGSSGQLSSKSVSLELPDDDGKTEGTGIRNGAQQKITMSVRRKVKKASSMEDELEKTESVFQAHDKVTPTNIPMELVYYYQTYMYKVVKEEKVDGTTAMFMLSFSNELMNILAQLERILRTPIPLAYSIHLHQSIWLYMLTLPFQMVGKLGWITVPGMALGCFALLGILAIGGEIENPFGYDDNDLPLDEFCEVIQHEVAKFASQKFPHPNTWIFHENNTPFGMESQFSSLDLKSMEESEFHSHFANMFQMDEEQRKDYEKKEEEKRKEEEKKKEAERKEEEEKRKEAQKTEEEEKKKEEEEKKKEEQEKESKESPK